MKIKNVKQAHIEPHSFCKGIRAYFRESMSPVPIIQEDSIRKKTLEPIFQSMDIKPNSVVHINLCNLHSVLLVKMKDNTYFFASSTLSQVSKGYFKSNKLLDVIIRHENHSQVRLKEENIVSIPEIDAEQLVKFIEELADKNQYHFLTNNCASFSAKVLSSLVSPTIKLENRRIFQMPQNTHCLALEVKNILKNQIEESTYL